MNLDSLRAVLGTWQTLSVFESAFTELMDRCIQKQDGQNSCEEKGRWKANRDVNGCLNSALMCIALYSL